MLKLILFPGIFLLAVIQSGHCKYDKSLPPECRNTPVTERDTTCTKQGGFKYNAQTNACFYNGKLYCPGKNGFTTMEQCVYKCWDYTKMDAREKVDKNMDVCIKEIKEDEMESPIPIPDLDSKFKDNRCREPNEKGLKVGSKPTKNPAYKYDKDKNQCVPVKTNICMGRNRSSSQDECIHICVWHKQSGRFRHNVRAGKN
uniref:Putative secreted salivary protein n=1 Tax=Culicoides sonorensis TaxID=179676 RepID=Q66U91_CULSO|nr:putative secreted salivary protein [Culicoides sonorensis]